MIVSIQFDDQNRQLAHGIGSALINYGIAVPETDWDAVAEAGRIMQEQDVPTEDRKLAPFVPAGTPVEDIETKDVKEPLPSERPSVAPPIVVPVDPPAPTPIIPPTSPVGLTGSTDEHGVTFDPTYCGKAAQPFYGSGKRKGQWKKLRGLDDSTYDEWYAEQKAAEYPRAELPQQAEPEPTPQAADTTAAFGGQAAAAVEMTDPVPAGAGQLMKWISEQMNAGHLTQADVDSAYTTADVTPAQLFSDDPDAVGKLYGVLQASLA